MVQDQSFKLALEFTFTIYNIQFPCDSKANLVALNVAVFLKHKQLISWIFEVVGIAVIIKSIS